MGAACLRISLIQLNCLGATSYLWWGASTRARRTASTSSESSSLFHLLAQRVHAGHHRQHPAARHGEISFCHNHDLQVYIHGGGFVAGEGGSTIYGPHFLMDEGVVVVSLQYRWRLWWCESSTGWASWAS